MTRSEGTRAEITALIKARRSALWVWASDEERTEGWLTESAALAKRPVRFLDTATGMTDPQDETKNVPAARNPSQWLQMIREDPAPMVYVLRDLHSWLKDPTLVRDMRSTIRFLRTRPLREARTIIVLSPSDDIPMELKGSITLIEWPIPDREELGTLLDTALEALPPERRAAAVESRDKAIDAALGLAGEAAFACFEKSLVVTKGRIDPKLVISEKKRVIASTSGLAWYEPDPRGLDAVGGLELAKQWIWERRAAFSQEARDYGLPAPKGVFLVGLPGTGKSLLAKVIAAVYGTPLLRADLGAASSKYVGESEQNMRKLLAMVDTVSPCVLWLDEVDKVLKGASGEAGDGGVQADKLGALLQWMQDKKSASFVIATANDVRGLPPEFLRKGRFDEIFWVDLPTHKERIAVLRVALDDAKARAPRWQAPCELDLSAVADVTQGFTGAELATGVVPDAMFTAFNDGQRAITTEDLMRAAKRTVPLSTTAKAKLDELREWAKGRARFASAPEATTGGGTALDLE
jgi:AAA+ superfamily predicted ATPase